MFRQLVCRGARLAQTNTRFFATAAPTSQKLDPIQQLFVDKIHEYDKKAKSSGDRLVEATTALKKSLSDEMEKIERQYIGKNEDPTSFPSFSFSDPTLEAVGIGDVKAQEAEKATETQAVVEEDYRAEKAVWDI
ncbi:DgyrCDS11893 [Dimorphilus gyrociliatus]|uniref:DgyrCDS11893 n=1 Tax=Dimorphilus gyrociliatus TaxID=2664684 RepID=A0A7I8W5V6_9ANNE|nr:DgyrCDS11893 [Dimorphilus gyrociliatus]